jgi:predicted nucleotidyltransferase
LDGHAGFTGDISTMSSLASYCRTASIEMLILFGSRATGADRRSSDVDLAVQAAKGANLSKLQLIFDLGEIFHPDPVDLVLLTPFTSPVLLYEIFFKGKLLYEESKGLFEEGRLRAWKLYLDTARLRSRQIRHFKEYTSRTLYVP